ncbi:MAG: 4Fe-4S binding protein [Phycisphaerales bacterium]|nr:MAG: 4Fe-4S binding protein [Phycisphaerales bacterium]
MRFSRGLLLFSYGLFTIAAQTLLFREFIGTFEGNDISVGIFFGSWFLWVGLGAVIVRKAQHFADKLLANVELLFLAYLPAFVLELALIIQVRELAGIESYALLSIRSILFWSMVVNAPVSVITGMLFPTACRWVEQEDSLAVSRVYILEAAGSFVGGLGVTLLLGLGASLVRVFLLLAFVVCVSVFAVRLCEILRRRTRTRARDGAGGYGVLVFSFVGLLAVGLCLFARADEHVMQRVRVVKWTKLLGKEALRGSFQTPQAEYLYGVYGDQWIAVREGSVCEALPDKATAGRIAAISLCQNPEAERVLVVGSGLGLCRELLRLPQIARTDWAHPDSEYVRLVGEFIPPELRIDDERFHPVGGDIRSMLAGKSQDYDVVILNLPDAVSSVLNRYFTVEFYRKVKGALRPGGVLAVRVAGGENVMGTELVNLGASTRQTLTEVFSRFVLVPGEDSWFLASDSDKLSGDPATLRDRFAAIVGASDIFSPEAILSVYLPDRAERALATYSKVDLPKNLLVNRDGRPLTHLYSMLLAAKQSGAPVSRVVRLLTLAGATVFLVPILVFVVLRVLYLWRMAADRSNSVTRPSGFDSSFLVFSAGWVSIGVVIVLMYSYQTRFGSLYLHIGVISSLFMVGLVTGASIVRRLLKAHVTEGSSRALLPLAMLFVVILVHTLILTGIATSPTEWRLAEQTVMNDNWEPEHLVFAIAFVLCGLCSGCYFPIAARQLSGYEYEAGQAGGKLETADHLGAAAGGLVTSLVLVPILGTKIAMFMLAGLIVANVPPALLRVWRRRERPLAGVSIGLRRLGYVLFGVGASVVLCSNILAAASARLRPSLPEHVARALAGQLHLEKISKTLVDSGRDIDYFEAYEIQQDEQGNVTDQTLTGYIFSSEDLAPAVRGFGGRMNLAIHLDHEGKLLDFHVVRSNETPAYLKLLDEWYVSLGGRGLFGPRPFQGIDPVTGATVSSAAVLEALERSGHRFTAEVLGREVRAGDRVTLAGRGEANVKWWGAYVQDRQVVYLIAALALALVVTYWGGFWSRLLLLCVCFVAGGVVVNAQYSIEQVVSLLSLHTPAVALTGAFLLVVGVPLIVTLFGNIYCGYMCPFGAAQELLGYVVPARFKWPIPRQTMQKARFVKYGVLFVLIGVFFLSRNRTTLAADPLVSVFGFRFSLGGFQWLLAYWQQLAQMAVVIVLVGSLFYVRFWCRYLCPVGAFLSLLNNVALLKRYLPAKKFGKCEFGLSARDNLDCIYCDRCRYETKAAAKKERVSIADYAAKGLLPRYFAVAVVAVAAVAWGSSVKRFLEVVPIQAEYEAEFAASGGQPRDVDVQQIKKMIEQKRLSDREAEFYKKVE